MKMAQKQSSVLKFFQPTRHMLVIASTWYFLILVHISNIVTNLQVEKLRTLNCENIVEYKQCVDILGADQISKTLGIIMMRHRENVATKFKEKPASPYLIWKFIRDVSNALRELHRLQIIHRDVKPGNVVLGMTILEFQFNLTL